jgi:hypothetical protein
MNREKPSSIKEVLGMLPNSTDLTASDEVMLLYVE